MKITVFAAGSRGDIQPCVALSRGLQAAGYQVAMAAPVDFRDFVERHGVAMRPLRGDVQQIMASDTGRDFMETGGGSPLASIRAVHEMIGPVIGQMAQDLYEACQDADAIVCLGVFAAFGQSVAEKLSVPILNIEPTPLLPTRAFAAPSWPIQRNLGGPHNWLSGLAMLDVIWQWYRPFVNGFRRDLGLPSYAFPDFYRALRDTPLLCAYSPQVIPPPADWPDTAHVTGYLFGDADDDWLPPDDLQAFLDDGEPPVYIGFGSMAGREPQRLASLALDALAMTGQRGLLLTGWGGLRADQVPDSALLLQSAPHSWLFPRMAAAVHHGGAGTTAESLRAGLPTIIVPFVLDQPFWGARISALGLGPAPIKQKRLTADRLAQAIEQAVRDDAMRQRAHHCGAAIRQERGVAAAVERVKSYLGAPRTSEVTA